MDQESARQFGTYLKSLRLERQLSVRRLATKARISSSALSRLETNNNRKPQPATLKALAEALEVPLSDMFVMAGYIVHDLPSMNPYLRAKYGHLPEKTLTEIDSYLKKIIDEHGLEPYGPVDLEDEKTEPSKQ